MDVKQYENKSGHAVMSPSQMSRIILCPGSVSLTLRAPIPKSSSYAIRGTELHEWMVEVFKMTDPEAELKRTKLSREEQHWLLEAMDYYHMVLRACKQPMNVRTETQVNLGSWGLPETYGTADKMFNDSPRILHVMDWKFGRGVQVFAENNEQAMTYGAGAAGNPNSLLEEVHLHIVQPPLNHFDEYVLSYDELCAWVWDTLTPAIELARSDNPPFCAGEKQCRWCPAAMTCRHRYKSTLEKAAQVFRDYSADIPPSPDELAGLLLKLRQLNTIRSELEAYGQGELINGRAFGDFKMVAGRNTRLWLSPTDADEYLRLTLDDPDERFIAKLVSPAQAEKLDRGFRKNETFRDLIETKSGKPQMVPGSDKREAIIMRGGSTAFKNV